MVSFLVLFSDFYYKVDSLMMITNLDEHCAQAYMAGRKEGKLIEMKKIGSGTVRHHQH